MAVRQARYIKEIEDYRVLSRENFEYYPHFHVQIEIMYLERGREEVIIDGSHFRMEEGDVCISFPNQVHEYRLLEENMAYLLIMPVEDVAEYRRELTECVPINPIVRADMLPGYFSYLWRDYFDKHRKGMDIRESKAVGRMLFSILFSRLALKDGRNMANMSEIQVVLDFIAKHYTEDISIDRMAKKTGISVSSLTRIFSKKMNTTFTVYVNALRILRAQKCLRKTERAMEEVAVECGFGSKRNFSVFLKRSAAVLRESTGRIMKKQKFRIPGKKLLAAGLLLAFIGGIGKAGAREFYVWAEDLQEKKGEEAGTQDGKTEEGRLKQIIESPVTWIIAVLAAGIFAGAVWLLCHHRRN